MRSLKALQQWPYSGVPQNPGGWLFRVARNGALDVLRRNAAFAARAHEIAAELQRASAMRAVGLGDRRRRAADGVHVLPSVAPARRARGAEPEDGRRLQRAEIARAFLSTEPTIAQRLVRAKRRCASTALAWICRTGADLAARTDSVLEVIYLLFNEGYSAHARRRL